MKHHEIDAEAPQPRLPALPPEAELPPPDRPAWSAETVRRLLREGTTPLRSWAFRWAERHPEGLASSDVGAALSFLLDHEDPRVRRDALLAAQRFRTDACADGIAETHDKFLADLIAQRLPSARQDRTYDSALRALQALDPLPHFDTFRDALEHEDDTVVEAGLTGLELSDRQEAAEIILGFIERAPHSSLAARAVASLSRLREPQAFSTALRLVLEASDDALDSWLEVCVGLDDALSDSQLMRMESELWEGRKPGAPAFSLFFPKTDTEAACRANRIVTPERLDELLAHEKACRWPEFSRLCAILALEALDLSVAARPDFAPLGEILGVLARALIETAPGESNEDGDDDIALEAGAILACAIRGRDLPRERIEAGTDPEKLLDLLGVDDAWLDERLLSIAASALSEEKLAPLLEAGDHQVRVNARAILALKNPPVYLEPILACMCALDHEDVRLVLGSARDSMLLPLYERARIHSQGGELVAFTVSSIGSERARWILDHSADAVLERISLSSIARLLLGCAGRGFAEKAFERIRAGEADFSDVARSSFDEEEVIRDLASAAELHGLSIVAAGAFAEGKEKLKLAGEWPEGRDDYYDEYEDDDEEGKPWDEPDEEDGGVAEEIPITPIRREAPKIGRNEPCPCGSGKKYKKCCGK